MTESVCALGAADRLVGCTDYCEEPADALAAVPRVGGTKNPKRERIAALEPDLVIANGEENRSEDIEWLRQRFAVLEHLPRTVPDAAEALRELAAALGRRAGAVPLLLRIEAELLRADAARLEHGSARVCYLIWRKPWMSVNGDTYIHDVLTRAGGVNVCAGMAARYPTIEPATIATAGVDVVLLASEPWAFTAADRAEIEARQWFGPRAAVICCDGRDFCWHGARSGPGLGRALDLLLRFRPPA